MKKNIVNVIWIVQLFFAVQVKGQGGLDTTTVNLMNEIEMIQQRYSSHSDVQALYTLMSVDSTGVTYDTVSVSMYMDKDKYKIVFDSALNIQNDRYNVTIYPDTKILIIQRTLPKNTTLLAFDINSSLFQEMGLTGIVPKDSSGFRVLTFQFDSTSMYKSYELVYRIDNYDLHEVKFKLLRDPDFPNLGFVQMHMRYLSFKIGSYDDSIFSTDGYFTVKSISEIVLGTTLSNDYEIVNMLGN